MRGHKQRKLEVRLLQNAFLLKKRLKYKWRKLLKPESHKEQKLIFNTIAMKIQEKNLEYFSLDPVGSGNYGERFRAGYGSMPDALAVTCDQGFFFRKGEGKK